MTQFKLHTLETAPEGAKEILEEAQKQNGFIPNLYKIMAESPEVLKAYTQRLSSGMLLAVLNELKK